ncbi:MAG: recombination and repair protein RecT [Candidatus Izimaplasma bacterium HR2]|nr:MAG: recombination and repair protein RecT [Candidatus Izimaplasma bacterium HR2]
MANNEGVKNALTKEKDKSLSAARQKYNSVSTMLEGMKESMLAILPKYMTPERMARIVLINCKQNPKLLNCTDSSIAGAVIQSVQLGIEPVLGNAYLIPYGNECVFQLGYPGLIDLFYRHKNAGILDVHIVHENDEFDYELGTSAGIKHKPAKSNRGIATHYYCVIELTTGFKRFGVMDIEEIKAHAQKYSQAYRAKKKDSPWFTAFPSMAKKTVAIQVLAFSPKSAVMQQALSSDGSMRDFNPDDDSIFETKAKYEDPVINPDDERTTTQKKKTAGKEKIESAEVVEPKETETSTEPSINDKFKIKCDEYGITGEVLVRYFNEVVEWKIENAEDIYTNEDFETFRNDFVNKGTNLNALKDIKKSM